MLASYSGLLPRFATRFFILRQRFLRAAQGHTAMQMGGGAVAGLFQAEHGSLRLLQPQPGCGFGVWQAGITAQRFNLSDRLKTPSRVAVGRFQPGQLVLRHSAPVSSGRGMRGIWAIREITLTLPANFVPFLSKVGPSLESTHTQKDR